VAEAAETVYLATIDQHAATLGFHYRAAELWDRALPYLREAGVRDLAAGAQREAAACLEQAIDCLERVPDAASRKAEGIDLRIELRHALVLLGEFERMGLHLATAERLAVESGDRARQGRILAFLANYFLNIGELERGRDAVSRAQAMAGELGDETLAATVRMFTGMLAHQAGRFREGAEIYRQFLRAANEGIVR
jgi:tetratricopeptide (TPR) repeat protein